MTRLTQIGTILYNLKNVKNTHGGVLLLVKLEILAIVQIYFQICDTLHDLIRLAPFKKHEKHP